MKKFFKNSLDNEPIEDSNNLDYKDKLYLLQNQTVIGKECLEKKVMLLLNSLVEEFLK
jgi:hypothetical protein